MCSSASNFITPPPPRPWLQAVFVLMMPLAATGHETPPPCVCEHSGNPQSGICEVPIDQEYNFRGQPYYHFDYDPVGVATITYNNLESPFGGVSCPYGTPPSYPYCAARVTVTHISYARPYLTHSTTSDCIGS